MTLGARASAREIDREQARRFRDLGLAGRRAAFLDLQETLERVALAGIRARHGDADARSERLRLFALRLNREQMIRAFDWDPEREGR